MLIIGVDPGLTGAISLLCHERGLLQCMDLPVVANGLATGKMLRWIDADALQSLLSDWSKRFEFATESVHACIERPIPMPSMPSTTTASSFDSFGVIRALLYGKVAPGGLAMVNPREWKKFFGLSTDKDASRRVALSLYANAPVARAKDHNRAESILIGHFAMRGMA